MSWQDVSAFKRTRQGPLGRRQAAPTQRHTPHKPPEASQGTMKRSEPQRQSHRHLKANRKGPKAPAKCGGRSTPGLSNNRYL